MHSQAACDAAHRSGAHAARLGFSWEENPYTQATDVLLRIEWNLGWWDQMRPEMASERATLSAPGAVSSSESVQLMRETVALPIDFLRTIEDAAFPLRFEVQQSIQCVHVLLAAELVEATVTYGEEPGSYLLAIVHGITPTGRAALARDAAYKPFA